MELVQLRRLHTTGQNGLGGRVTGHDGPPMGHARARQDIGDLEQNIVVHQIRSNKIKSDECGGVK